MDILKAIITLSAATLVAGLSTQVFSKENSFPVKGPISFEIYDMNKDGNISEDEFNSIRTKIMTEKTSQNKRMNNAGNAPIFSDFDKNKDGLISINEFKAGQLEQKQKRMARMQSKKGNMGQNKGKRQGRKSNMPSYSDLDLNGDGILLEDEFNQARANRISERAKLNYPMKNVASMPAFSDIDLDGNGEVSAEEFAKHQMAHRKNRE